MSLRRTGCGDLTALPGRHQGPETPRPLGGAQLPERLRLDLADAFPRDIEFLADFLKSVLTLTTDSEPHPDHLLLLGRKGLQDTGSLVANIGFDHGIDRRPDPTVLDEIPERGLAIAADRRFQGNRIARNGLQLLHFFDRNIHPPADFVIGRSAAD